MGIASGTATVVLPHRLKPYQRSPQYREFGRTSSNHSRSHLYWRVTAEHFTAQEIMDSPPNRHRTMSATWQDPHPLLILNAHPWPDPKGAHWTAPIRKHLCPQLNCLDPVEAHQKSFVLNSHNRCNQRPKPDSGCGPREAAFRRVRSSRHP